MNNFSENEDFKQYRSDENGGIYKKKKTKKEEKRAEKQAKRLAKIAEKQAKRAEKNSGNSYEEAEAAIVAAACEAVKAAGLI